MADYTPPAGAVKNQAGYWIMPDGDFAPGQDMSGQMAGATDAQRNASIGQTQTDPQKGLTYRMVNGQRWYDPPASGAGDAGGGLIHGRTQWNPQTGAYDTPLDWGKILSMVAAGVITAGAADAVLSSTPALAATAPEGASAASATGADVGATTAAADSAASAAAAPVADAAGGAAADAAGTTAADAAGAAGGDAFDAAGNFVGSATDATGSTVAGSGLPSSTLGELGSTLGKFAPIAGSIGQAIGKANTAAGGNRLNQENLGLVANTQNINGQSAFEQELMNRAKEEDVQRTKAGKDVYRASYNANPRVSPYDPAGAPKYSAQYLSTAQQLADQGADTLSKPATYATGAQPALKPYTPINPADVQGATNTNQGTASKIGDYVGPALSTAQLIAKLWPGN